MEMRQESMVEWGEYDWRQREQAREEVVFLRPKLPCLPKKNQQQTNVVQRVERGPAVGIQELWKKTEDKFQQQQRLKRQKAEKEEADRQAKIKREREEAEARRRQEQAERKRKQAEKAQKQADRLKKIEEERLKKEEEQRLKKQAEQKQAQRIKDEQAKEKQLADSIEKQKQDALQKEREEEEMKSRRRNAQLSRYKEAGASIFLDQVIEFANSIKQGRAINCAINSVGDIKKVTKDLIIWTDSFIQKVNTNDTQEVNTFCVKVWNVIVNELIMKARKDGIEIVPPTREDAEIFKNCINTYILMINLLRVKGMEKVWMYMVGKTLDLLDFIYKRKENLNDFKSLDLVAKRYITKFGQNFENIYFSRLDQLTYFLFGMLLMNPYDCFMEIADRTRQLPNDVRGMVNALNKPWDYSIFWLLIQEIRVMPYRYYKPVIYANVLSILNIHLSSAKSTSSTNQFVSLFRTLTLQLIGFPKIQAKDPEIKTIISWDVDGYLQGQQFIDMLAPIRALGGQKKKLLQNPNVDEVRTKGSVLYYFKSQQQ